MFNLASKNFHQIIPREINQLITLFQDPDAPVGLLMPNAASFILGGSIIRQHLIPTTPLRYCNWHKLGALPVPSKGNKDFSQGESCSLSATKDPKCFARRSAQRNGYRHRSRSQISRPSMK